VNTHRKKIAHQCDASGWTGTRRTWYLSNNNDGNRGQLHGNELKYVRFKIIIS
jgi:hypothetical protein